MNVDATGAPTGPVMNDPERQHCGRLVNGIPCYAPGTIHGDMGDAWGFACPDHAIDFKSRCVDYHQTDTACGLPGSSWMRENPSRCEIPFDLLLQEIAELELQL